jgi:hypothetical protein
MVSSETGYQVDYIAVVINDIFLFWEENNQESYVPLRIRRSGAVMNNQSEILLDMPSCMLSIIARELRRATSRGFSIPHTEIQCLQLQRGRWCRGPNRIFLPRKLWLQFSSHRLNCCCWISSQKALNSIKIISLIRCFPIYTAKGDELRGARVFRVVQSTWTIQCVKDHWKTWEETHCASSSPIVFTRPKPV